MTFGIREIMNANEKKTIEVYGTRNTFTIYLITMGFALVGGGLIIYHSGRILWSIWIPLCFFIIPVLHHLAKKVIELEARISELEKK